MSKKTILCRSSASLPPTSGSMLTDCYVSVLCHSTKDNNVSCRCASAQTRHVLIP